MNIGIYGGTFNPVHLGHVNMLSRAVKAAKLDRVLVVPDRIPPHKAAQSLASGRDRLRMCRIAFRDIEEAEICDWELKREGKSYSVITLRHFKEAFPGDRLYFIMGSDMLISFHKWYCYEEILSLAGLICISRSGGDSDAVKDQAQRLRDMGAEIITVTAEPFEASSSQVRELIEQGSDCEGLMDRGVMDYIRSRGLYCCGAKEDKID